MSWSTQMSVWLGKSAANAMEAEKIEAIRPMTIRRFIARHSALYRRDIEDIELQVSESCCRGCARLHKGRADCERVVLWLVIKAVADGTQDRRHAWCGIMVILNHFSAVAAAIVVPSRPPL